MDRNGNADAVDRGRTRSAESDEPDEDPTDGDGPRIEAFREVAARLAMAT